jgi:signal transduction histidine kinase
VRTQAKKFAEFYGIEAQVVADGDIPVSTPMQDGIIHIVREGLSNIRRHTSAERATINLREAHRHLLVELINDKGAPSEQAQLLSALHWRARKGAGRPGERAAP